MSFGQRELALVGRWPPTSRVPERYGRSVCASELLLRNTITQRMANGWGPAPAYRLPDTILRHLRIGKPTDRHHLDHTDNPSQWKETATKPSERIDHANATHDIIKNACAETLRPSHTGDAIGNPPELAQLTQTQ